MKLLISKPSAKKTQLALADDEGNIVRKYANTFTTDKAYADAARILQLDKDLIYAKIGDFERAGGGELLSLMLNQPSQQQPAVSTVFVRGRLEGNATARRFDSETCLQGLQDAISADDVSVPNPIIYWEDRSQLCALDCDFHGLPYEKRPDERRMGSVLSRLSPVPFAAWLTHGKGYRFLYTASEGFAADELASVAAIAVRNMERHAEVELTKSTRHPGYPDDQGNRCGEVKWLSQIVDLAAVRGWFSTYETDEKEVKAWLAENGLEIGKRYDHSRCPFHPDSGGDRQPVVINDNHIYCFLCHAKGRCCGHSIAGLFPYGAFVGTRITTALRNCVTNLTHWEQAKYIVASHLRMEGEVAKLAYKTALKMCHPNDPRIDAAFYAGDDFVRFHHRWSNLRGEALTKDNNGILFTLPACQFVTPDGAIKVSKERISRFNQPADLSKYGYMTLEPIWGMRVYGQHLEMRNPNLCNIVLQNAVLNSPEVARFRPCYVGPSKRKISEEAAWDRITTILPGLDRQAVKCLIAARGVSEGDVGPPPFIYISGPSKSAKSMTVVIAAAIIGDYAHTITGGMVNEERARQGLLEAKEKGSFCVWNEALKRVVRGKRSAVDIMSFALNLTPDSTSHKLYVGPVALGRMPVVVFTDTFIPEELFQDKQISRRIVHIHMPNQVDWAKRFKDNNVFQPQELRLSGPEVTEACNVIASSVIDEYFQEPLNFEEVAALLGYHPMDQSPTAESSVDALIDFFHAVCAAESPTESSDLHRWKGRGWKIIERNQNSDLKRIWEEVSDDNRNGCFSSSRRCSEVDWQHLLRAREAIRFEISCHSENRIAVRFISVKNTTRKNYRVNQELIGDATELAMELESAPANDGLNRLGNAIPVELEGCWLQDLPSG
jgi:hypothetical protein